MTQVRRDRPRPATLGLVSLSEQLSRLRLDAALQEHGRDSLTLVRDPDMQILLVALAPGGRLPEHRAPGPIAVLVLEGRIAFTADGTRLEAGPHDLITLQAHTPHAVEALEPSAVLVTIATPKAREVPQSA